MINQDHREKWIKTLYDLRLEGFTATILEALGPLGFLGAQLVYLSQPVFSLLIADDHSADLARILEDPSETASFIKALRSYAP